MIIVPFYFNMVKIYTAILTYDNCRKYIFFIVYNKTKIKKQYFKIIFNKITLKKADNSPSLWFLLVHKLSYSYPFLSETYSPIRFQGSYSNTRLLHLANFQKLRKC